MVVKGYVPDKYRSQFVGKEISNNRAILGSASVVVVPAASPHPSPADLYSAKAAERVAAAGKISREVGVNADLAIEREL